MVYSSAVNHILTNLNLSHIEHFLLLLSRAHQPYAHMPSPLYSTIISWVKLWRTTLQLGLWAAADNEEHRLSFHINIYKVLHGPTHCSRWTVAWVSMEAVF